MKILNIKRDKQMNRYDLMQLYSPELITDEIIKISAASIWKCRLCAFAKTDCNKDCKTGIKKFFTDEVTENEK